MPDRGLLGAWGEEVAGRYLEERGWVLLARNYRFGQKELDLIARQGDVIAFVEVKTRHSASGFGHPFEAIGRRKRAELEKAAVSWVQRWGQESFRYRFDAIAVIPIANGEARVEHLEDAWRIAG